MSSNRFSELLLEYLVQTTDKMTEVADKVGIDRKSLQRYQSGESRPDIFTLHRIVSALELDSEEGSKKRDKLYRAYFDAENTQPEVGLLKSLIGGGNVLGSLLRSWRDRRGETSHQVSKKSGVSRTCVADFEDGRRIPSVKDLDKLLAALEVPPEGQLTAFTAATALWVQCGEKQKRHFETKPHGRVGAQAKRMERDITVVLERYPSLKELHKQLKNSSISRI